MCDWIQGWDWSLSSWPRLPWRGDFQVIWKRGPQRLNSVNVINLPSGSSSLPVLNHRGEPLDCFPGDIPALNCPRLFFLIWNLLLPGHRIVSLHKSRLQRNIACPVPCPHLAFNKLLEFFWITFSLYFLVIHSFSLFPLLLSLHPPRTSHSPNYDCSCSCFLSLPAYQISSLKYPFFWLL